MRKAKLRKILRWALPIAPTAAVLTTISVLWWPIGAMIAGGLLVYPIVFVSLLWGIDRANDFLKWVYGSETPAEPPPAGSREKGQPACEDQAAEPDRR